MMSRYGGQNRSRRSTAGGCLQLFVVAIIVVGFISFGPFTQGRDFLCKITHIKFFCRGIIAVTKVKVGNDTVNVGLSEGDYAFDIHDPDGGYKLQAVQDLNAGLVDDAKNDWRQAINTTTDDAEAMIYLENQAVADSHKPFGTIVVATTLSEISNDSSTSISVARDDLRGAYWAQREFNADHTNFKIRLVLANLGVRAQSYLELTEDTVLQQIIRLAETDDSLIGVVGFPFSASARIAFPKLEQYHIPIVSPSASSKDLTNISSYAFRVVPSDVVQAQDAAQFAKTVLGVHTAAILSDTANTYSGSLGDSFATSFSQLGSGHTVIPLDFSLSNPQSLSKALHKALTHNPHPDLIYLAGYAPDLNTLKSLLAKSTASNIPVLGGDASYELGGYTTGNYANFYFTAFTYPDIWDILCPSQASCARVRPSVSNILTYSKTFDPKALHSGQYSYARMGPHVLLTYDATRVLLLAADNVVSETEASKITKEAVHDALQQVSFQGATGIISFNGSDPVKKTVVMLCVDRHHLTKLVRVYGQFALGTRPYQPNTDYIKNALCL